MVKSLERETLNVSLLKQKGRVWRMGKSKEESEAIEEILSYIDLTLKETNMTRADILKHYDHCPLCGALIIECPFCHANTPIGYNCQVCKEVLPLETLLKQIAEKIIERQR